MKRFGILGIVIIFASRPLVSKSEKPIEYSTNTSYLIQLRMDVCYKDDTSKVQISKESVHFMTIRVAICVIDLP